MHLGTHFKANKAGSA